MISLAWSFAVLLSIGYSKISTEGSFLHRPVDQSVEVSDDVLFQCQSSPESSVRWTYTYVGGPYPKNLYLNGVVQNGYAERFSVNRSVPGKFDLAIKRVSMSDAGRYSCVVNDGKNEESADAELQVRYDPGPLRVVPEDTTVIAGQDVRLNCSSNYFKNAWWRMSPVRSTTADDIYMGYGGLVGGYRSGGRHSVDADDAAGDYNLLIRNVQRSDAGRYFCVDKSGLGKTAAAELVVLESSPSCASNLQPDGVIRDDLEFCDIRADVIEMSCKVDFSGNIPPLLKWMSLTRDDAKRSEVTVNTTSSFEVSLTINASSGVSVKDLYCHTKLHGRSHDSCRMQNIKTIFLSNATELRRSLTPEILECSVETNQDCEYSWVQTTERVSQKQNVKSRTLNISHPGEDYMCQAECTVRGKSCTVYPVVVKFNADFHSYDCYGSKASALLFVLVIPILIVAGAILFVFMRRRNRKLKTRNQGSYILASRKGEQAVSNSDTLKSMTIFDSKLYAVFEGYNGIRVYHGSPPFDFIREIKIETLKTPVDIVGCKKSNCIYISDSANRCIWKVAFGIFQTNYSISKFIRDVSCTFKISVTPSAKVILVTDKSDTTASIIKIYNGDGELVKSIRLKSDTESLQHAVLNRHDRFIVSFRGRIGEVDKLGNILLSFPPINDPEFDTEETSRYITMDESNHTFVSQYENNKILVLNNDLREIGNVEIGNQPPNTRYLQKFVLNREKLCVGIASGEILAVNIPDIEEDADVENQPCEGTSDAATNKTEDVEMCLLKKQLKEKDDQINSMRKQLETSLDSAETGALLKPAPSEATA